MSIAELVESLFEDGKTPMEQFGINWEEAENLEKLMHFEFECIEAPSEVDWYTVGKKYNVIKTHITKVDEDYYVKSDDGVISLISKVNGEYVSLMVPSIKFRKV